MGEVHTTWHLAVSPEQAFAFGAKAERLPEWDTSMVEVKDVSGPLDTVGAGYTGVMKLGGRRLEGRWEVTRVDRPGLLELKGVTPGGGEAKPVIRYAPGPGGTDMSEDLTYTLPGGLAGRLADWLIVERVIERQFRHSGEKIKAILEAETTAAG